VGIGLAVADALAAAGEGGRPFVRRNATASRRRHFHWPATEPASLQPADDVNDTAALTAP